MADPTAIQPAHTMTPTEIILYAATAIGGVVGGVISQTLRVGARVKALEDALAKQATQPADISKLRDEVAAQMRDINAALAASKADPVAIRAIVTELITPLLNQVATIAAQHGATTKELDRVRDAADSAEKEGAHRWERLSETLGEIRARLQNL